jgi:hypothetical protein
MNNQEILNSEPPKQGKWPDCNQVDSDGKWSNRQPIIRSLADIKRIVELEAYLQKVQADRINDIAIERKRWAKADLVALGILRLEQQVQGVRDFFTNHRPRISMGKSAIWEVDDVLVDECIEGLTNKAQALKEPTL